MSNTDFKEYHVQWGSNPEKNDNGNYLYRLTEPNFHLGLKTSPAVVKAWRMCFQTHMNNKYTGDYFVKGGFSFPSREGLVITETQLSQKQMLEITKNVWEDFFLCLEGKAYLVERPAGNITAIILSVFERMNPPNLQTLLEKMNNNPIITLVAGFSILLWSTLISPGILYYLGWN